MIELITCTIPPFPLAFPVPSLSIKTALVSKIFTHNRMTQVDELTSGSGSGCVPKPLHCCTIVTVIRPSLGLIIIACSHGKINAVRRYRF